MKKIQFIVAFVFATSVCHAHTSDVVATVNSYANNTTVNSATTSSPKRAGAMIVGDVNGDLQVDLLDVVDLSRYLKGMARSAFIKSKADINGDGKIDIEDVKKLSNILVTDSDVTAAEEEVIPLRGDSNASPTL